MADFTGIEAIHYPKQILEEAFDFLRAAGVKGYEAVTLFAGRPQGKIYHVEELYIPVQESYKTPDGLMYQVSSEELSVLDDWLFDKQLSLFCQMHTHPGEAYHSFADNKNCIVTATGGVSIVVPDFAKDPINPRKWAVYRLMRKSGWTEVDENEIEKFIQIS